MSRTFMGTGINIGWAIGAAFLLAAAVDAKDSANKAAVEAAKK